MKKSLRHYNQKRDFKVTREPAGSTKKKVVSAKKKKLIFVVQEHHASHLHFDFRLEHDGVLKSWAVPKGPSMEVGQKRMAIQVEDHPLAYATFSGTIPKGQYGAGEVYIWDKGLWEIDGDVDAGLKKGRLEFKLKGKKLKGNWLLVKTHYIPGKDNTWLLIKRHDEKEIKVKKKVTNSKKKSQKNDHWPGFIKPQLPLLVNHPPDEAGWLHEIKFDGYRLQAHIRDGVVSLYTRNGHDWSEKFPHMVETLQSLAVDDAILDGEAVVLDNGKSNFQLLQNSLSEKRDKDILFYLFDIMFLNGEDLREKSLEKRKEILYKILPQEHSFIKYSDHITQKSNEFFKMACNYELEGIVSKDAKASYISGRNNQWCKSKCSKRQEFIIGGFTEGKGGRSEDLGALLLGVHENGKLRYVGKVGTGFDERTLKEIKKKINGMIVKRGSFEINTPNERGIQWVKPTLVTEIKFSNWTKEKLLRNPVFLGLRSDKKSEDIIIEKETSVNLVEHEVELSHPHKILFRKEKITKTQIANYYEAVSKFMLPLMGNRPLSLVRCPHGSENKCFYQKHPTRGIVPKNLIGFKVNEKKRTSLYVAVQSYPGLKQLVHLNAYEIHTWNTHYEHLMNPDQIVMDFDPAPDVAFKEVVKAAMFLKKILDKLKLKSFVKLSGGKGVHVHVPIDPDYTWDEIKAFTKALADQMELMEPDKYLANMSKKKRVGKIFIDYLRNGFGATAIAPYSLRNRVISSVAMPIEWSELSKIKSSDQFTLEKALKKIKVRKRDPWIGFNKVRQKISIL